MVPELLSRAHSTFHIFFLEMRFWLFDNFFLNVQKLKGLLSEPSSPPTLFWPWEEKEDAAGRMFSHFQVKNVHQLLHIWFPGEPRNTGQAFLISPGVEGTDYT